MSIEAIVDSGLCMQCGTCAGLCQQRAITMVWGLRTGVLPHVDTAACNDCGACAAVCPAEGLDFSSDAWWRERNGDAPSADFLGPWRGLWFGWAADEDVRYEGASGGVATAILQGALETGAIDAALLCRVDRTHPLAVEPVLARTSGEIATCRGSKYNVVALNQLLRTVRREPGRYALVGLPCHIQGLRLAQRRYPALREHVVLTVGIFCGWTALPRMTELAVRRAGLDPDDLISVSYRGPDWPGGMRLATRSGQRRELPYPGYSGLLGDAWTPTRCRLCPDGLCELADISIGDTWLDRFEGTAGVSDVIARTEAGAKLVGELTPARLTLTEATPDEMLASQEWTHRMKRRVLRGRLWLRALSGRAVPDYPGVPLAPSARDRLAGAGNLAAELFFRAVGDLRYR